MAVARAKELFGPTNIDLSPEEKTINEKNHSEDYIKKIH